jgi:hypothetical protein
MLTITPPMWFREKKMCPLKENVFLKKTVKLISEM